MYSKLVGLVQYLHQYVIILDCNPNSSCQLIESQNSFVKKNKHSTLIYEVKLSPVCH